jgi:hypothetical protein
MELVEIIKKTLLNAKIYIQTLIYKVENHLTIPAFQNVDVSLNY